MLIWAYVWNDDWYLTLTIQWFSLYHKLSNVLRLHTLVFAWVSRARLVFLSNFLLNSFYINCSLPVACFLSFQTFLSNVLSRFHLLRDVNLSVCLEWWLTFDTENPLFSLHRKLQMCCALTRWSLPWVFRARLVFIWRPLLNSNYMMVI